MGEARRRKLHGTYPDPANSIEAVRRFWCGRDPGPVEDFRSPEGTGGYHAGRSWFATQHVHRRCGPSRTFF
jgi:hypothetical protein